MDRIDQLKKRLEIYQTEIKDYTPEETLRFFLERHSGKVAFSTSLGVEDQVITHMLVKTGLPVKIFTLDTGRLFQETYDLLDITSKKYNIPILVYYPDTIQVETMVNQKGINLFYESVENRKLCCHNRKIEPIQRGLKGMEIWITGIRRDQSVTRTDIRLAEWEETVSLIKLNPLVEWNETKTWEYIRRHKIPYNILHDKGYPSIGCLPCTRAILPGEDIRAGRWWWEHPDLKECGLHRRTNH